MLPILDNIHTQILPPVRSMTESYYYFDDYKQSGKIGNSFQLKSSLNFEFSTTKEFTRILSSELKHVIPIFNSAKDKTRSSAQFKARLNFANLSLS